MKTSWQTECAKVHGPNWERWLGHLKGQPHVAGVELGTFEGDSALWMLTNIFTHSTSTYTCVDTFEGSEEHHLAGIDCSDLESVTEERLSSFENVQIYRMLSHEFLKGATGKIDFVYIDAAHDSMNVLRDSVLAFEILKDGGTMIWDDFTWSVYPDAIDCPKLGIESFLNCYARRLEIVGMGYQVCARKVS